MSDIIRRAFGLREQRRPKSVTTSPRLAPPDEAKIEAGERRKKFEEWRHEARDERVPEFQEFAAGPTRSSGRETDDVDRNRGEGDGARRGRKRDRLVTMPPTPWSGLGRDLFTAFHGAATSRYVRARVILS